MSTEEKDQWGWVPKQIGCCGLKEGNGEITELGGTLSIPENTKTITCGSVEWKEPQPGPHPNSARFHELLNEIGLLHNKKQIDYGRGDDPFANVRSSQEWGVKPWVGALIRLNDKVKRLQAFAIKGSLANESVDDSLRDIAVYALISLVLYEQEGRNKGA